MVQTITIKSVRENDLSPFSFNTMDGIEKESEKECKQFVLYTKQNRSLPVQPNPLLQPARKIEFFYTLKTRNKKEGEAEGNAAG